MHRGCVFKDFLFLGSRTPELQAPEARPVSDVFYWFLYKLVVFMFRGLGFPAPSPKPRRPGWGGPLRHPPRRGRGLIPYLRPADCNTWEDANPPIAWASFKSFISTGFQKMHSDTKLTAKYDTDVKTMSNSTSPRPESN